jgi:hypothetical protein
LNNFWPAEPPSERAVGRQSALQQAAPLTLPRRHKYVGSVGELPESAVKTRV